MPDKNQPPGLPLASPSLLEVLQKGRKEKPDTSSTGGEKLLRLLAKSDPQFGQALGIAGIFNPGIADTLDPKEKARKQEKLDEQDKIDLLAETPEAQKLKGFGRKLFLKQAGQNKFKSSLATLKSETKKQQLSQRIQFLGKLSGEITDPVQQLLFKSAKKAKDFNRMEQLLDKATRKTKQGKPKDSFEGFISNNPGILSSAEDADSLRSIAVQSGFGVISDKRLDAAISEFRPEDPRSAGEKFTPDFFGGKPAPKAEFNLKKRLKQQFPEQAKVIEQVFGKVKDKTQLIQRLQQLRGQ